MTITLQPPAPILQLVPPAAEPPPRQRRGRHRRGCVCTPQRSALINPVTEPSLGPGLAIAAILYAAIIISLGALYLFDTVHPY